MNPRRNDLQNHISNSHAAQANRIAHLQVHITALHFLACAEVVDAFNETETFSLIYLPGGHHGSAAISVQGRLTPSEGGQID